MFSQPITRQVTYRRVGAGFFSDLGHTLGSTVNKTVRGALGGAKPKRKRRVAKPKVGGFKIPYGKLERWIGKANSFLKQTKTLSIAAREAGQPNLSAWLSKNGYGKSGGIYRVISRAERMRTPPFVMRRTGAGKAGGFSLKGIKALAKKAQGFLKETKALSTTAGLLGYKDVGDLLAKYGYGGGKAGGSTNLPLKTLISLSRA